MNRQYHVEVISAKGSFYWRVVASNGEILAHSEQYVTKWNARRAARKMSKLTGFPLREKGSLL